MNKDTRTNIQELKDALLKFRNARDWKKYHTPKDLATAISVEAGELLGLFTWQSQEEITDRLENDQFIQCVKDELADVINCCLSLANRLDIDVASVVEEKIRKISEKYPVEKVKGESERYIDLKMQKHFTHEEANSDKTTSKS